MGSLEHTYSAKSTLSSEGTTLYVDRIKYNQQFIVKVDGQFPTNKATVSPWSLEDTYCEKSTWTSQPVPRG